MKKILITQSNYIPWIGWYDSIDMVDEWVIYDEVQFTKRDWRNRNKIKSPHGVQWLTIPVKVKGRFYQKINEVLVEDKSWNIRHWKSIKANYAQASGFQEARDLFEPLYLNTTSKLLTDINYSFNQGICKFLGINTKMRYSDEFDADGDPTEKLVNICTSTAATDYYTGPKARTYLNELKFIEAGIKVHYLDFSNYPTYTQLYGEFVPRLSVVDLICNHGKNAKRYMNKKHTMPDGF